MLEKMPTSERPVWEERHSTYHRIHRNGGRVEEYHVWNVRMIFSGGGTVYVDGNHVAFFNLVADYVDKELAIHHSILQVPRSIQIKSFLYEIPLESHV